jgi:DNA-binding NarL/FixJ family response regulator
MTARFIIADDHAMFRAGLRLFLSDVFAPDAIVDAASLNDLQAALTADPQVTLAVVDLRMPGMAGASTLMDLRERFPAVRFVVMSGSEERQDVLDVLAAGAFGYIPKSLDTTDMTAAFRQVLGGGVYAPNFLAATPTRIAEPRGDGDIALSADLTPRQRDVLRLLARGQSNKEIARALDISEGTVKIHLAAIFRLLDVRNRTEAVLKASQLRV